MRREIAVLFDFIFFLFVFRFLNIALLFVMEGALDCDPFLC